MSKVLWTIILFSVMGIVAITLLSNTGHSSGEAGTANTSYEDWGKSYKQALAEAKENQKPVLMLFTGSDWCPPCKLLHRNVFSKDEFKQYAKNHLTLLVLDFPKRFALPPEQETQNRELADQYNVDGFPTMILLSKDGEETHRFGYRGNQVTDFIVNLKEKLNRE